MQKTVARLFIIGLLFFTVWYSLTQINWVTIFNIEKAGSTTEKKLGELFWDLLKHTNTEFHNKKIIAPVDTLLTHLCTANGIDRQKIKLHVINKDDINAFTLPDRHIVVFSGLIEFCDSESELAGVLGHELAHAEKNHIMKKLIKEIGLSVLISITTGKSNPELIKEAIKLLSSTAYDRTLEREADVAAVEFLLESGIDPEPFANFLFRLSQQDNHLTKKLSWINTHPDSKER